MSCDVVQFRFMSLLILTVRQCSFLCDAFQEDVHEDMLHALMLPTNIIVAELFRSLNDYTSGRLNWLFYIGNAYMDVFLILQPESKEVTSE